MSPHEILPAAECKFETYDTQFRALTRGFLYGCFRQVLLGPEDSLGPRLLRCKIQKASQLMHSSTASNVANIDLRESPSYFEYSRHGRESDDNSATFGRGNIPTNLIPETVGGVCSVRESTGHR